MRIDKGESFPHPLPRVQRASGKNAFILLNHMGSPYGSHLVEVMAFRP